MINKDGFLLCNHDEELLESRETTVLLLCLQCDPHDIRTLRYICKKDHPEECLQ